MFVADFKMNSDPAVFSSFSAIVKCFKVLFYFKAVPIISPPVMPMSLSYKRMLSMFLFYKITAAIHFAPSTPNEFLRILPS